ncbi:hypothetical protein CMK22_10995 [Candidatus Poribacteria bacterium]|nr:hypothetical protein [Candidatus Poribacteria bacterium]
MIQAITFDFWQTLYADNTELLKIREDHRAHKCKDFLAQCNYQFTLEQIKKAYQITHEMVTEAWQIHRGVPMEECISKFSEMLEINLTPSQANQVKSLIGNSTLLHSPPLVPFIKDLLPKLSDKYQLGIISDTGITAGTFLREMLTNDGILDYFSVQTFSDETGFTKPEIVQYQKTLEKMKIKPSAALHIGDLVRTDITGAKNAGMYAIRFAGVTTEQENEDLADAILSDYRQLENTIEKLMHST